MVKRCAALTAFLAALIYVAMWIGWTQNWLWLNGIDQWLLNAGQSAAVRLPSWSLAWDWLCTLLGPMAFRLIGAGVIVVLLIRRRRRAALFVFVTVELSGILTEVAKRLADRPRPDARMVEAGGSSFPSGHALGVMVAVVALLTVAWPAVSPRWRAPLAVLGGFFIVAVGVGRVALNVHHPSDVLAGWALGYAYVVLCLAVVHPRGERPAEPDTAQ